MVDFEESFENFEECSAVITGGLGFIGSNLAHFLVEKGAHVTVIDSMEPTCGGNLFNVEAIKNKIKILKIDLKEVKKIKEELKDVNFIFNLAGRSTHNIEEGPKKDNSINYESHLNFLELLRKIDSNSKIVYSGTRTQYGKIKKNPVSEDDLIIPIDYNGAHKHFAEMYHLLYNRTYGIDACSLRLTNTYGPRQVMESPRLGVLPAFMKKAMNNQNILIHGEGIQTRDFNFVSDTINALCLAALTKKSKGEVFNVGSGNPVALNKLAKLIVQVCRSGSIEYKKMPENYRLTEIGNYVADISKIKEILKWEPKIGLKEGLEITHKFFIENKKHYW